MVSRRLVLNARDCNCRYVLFTGHTVFVSDWEEIAKDYREIDPTVIFAYVDLAANPGLRKRFDIKQLPQAYLFRERKVQLALISQRSSASRSMYSNVLGLRLSNERTT